ncbi:UbiA family prenyltransferase [Amycolatopsis sp., V23-08]|uniref:UbiA family prenyltransferase n=1 Tax=Amycolatopsis heterodermiae TaxID=3110235 RepID=A0ABU5RBA8_9PSEU|nr:UbiA family prenyltransferase [Amycolatopsis sp., V23-08]MEA5362526.1 UbiA family prenyltransferase [Amycolatopsis sp., V23-08]
MSGAATIPADGGNRIRTALAAHMECGRPDVGCYVGLVGLAGVALVSGRSAWYLVAAFLVPALLSTGAYYAGAYFDRNLDAVAKPGKPVPSGRVSARSALIAMVVCTVAGLALAPVLGSPAVVLGLVVVSAGALALYGRFARLRRPLRIFTRGIATMVAFGFVLSLANGSPLWDLVFAALIFWQQDSMLHQVLAVEDTEVDRRAGVQTLPSRYGHKAALVLLVVTFVFWFSSAAFQPATIQSRPFDALAYTPFAAVGTVLAIAALVVLFRAPRPLAGRPVLRAYGLLALARLCVAAGFVAAAGDLVLGLVLLAGSLVVTFLALPAVPAAVPQGVPEAAVEPVVEPAVEPAE